MSACKSGGGQMGAQIFGTMQGLHPLQAQAHAQFNQVPEPSISDLITEFEEIHSRIVTYAEHFHKIADRLVGPQPQPGSLSEAQKEQSPVGVLSRLYALRAMIDLQLDVLNDAMCLIDKAV